MTYVEGKNRQRNTYKNTKHIQKYIQYITSIHFLCANIKDLNSAVSIAEKYSAANKE